MRLRSLPVLFTLLATLLGLFLFLPLIYFLGALGGSNLGQALASPATVHALGVSLLSATISTALLTVLGIPLGYLLARYQFRGKTWVNILVFVPLICPPAASGILLLLFFGPNQGLGGLLNDAGVQLLDNLAGIVLAQLFVSAPFVIVTARATFESIPTVYEKISRTLGEGPLRTFWRVALPLARDGLLAGVILAWMRAMGEFGATLIMAYHPYTLPVLMWVQLSGSGLADALPVVLAAMLVSLVVLALLFRFDRRLGRLAGEGSAVRV